MHENFKVEGSPFKGEASKTFGINVAAATLSIQVIGTLSAGAYTLEVSNDGQTWVGVPVFSTEFANLPTISETGIYRADINAYQAIRLSSSGSVAGGHQIFVWGSGTPLGYYIAGS